MIAISYTHADFEIAAKKLAAALQIDFIPSIDIEKNVTQYEFLLLYTPDYLGIKKLSDKKSSPFFIDFLSKSLLYRLKQASRKKELIARAIGISPTQHPYIVDATAGLGRDSLILASLNYHVTMLERSPYVYYLLQDALDRAKKNDDVKLIVERLNLLMVDANLWLKQQTKQPDVIYLDPMFPMRKKSASVKKDMVFLQHLLGHEDGEDLFLTALSCAAKRVVVKRPRYAMPLAVQNPNFSIEGNNSRFDIYLK